MVHGNKEDKVLVTGASGYVGAHVLRVLLGRGYRVRGTVRSQLKADQIITKYPEFRDKLELVIVEDIAKDGAFEHAVQGIDGIFHVASPFHFKVTDNKTDLLDPAIKGTTGILESALKIPSVKRVVVTSSFASVIDPTKSGTGHTFTEHDWNPVTYEEALVGNPVTAYRGSKKFAEKALHDFVAERKPHFDVVAVCPPYIIGPFEHHVDKLSDLNESARQFYDIVSGNAKVPQTTAVDLFVDVRDIALAHVLAYESPHASNTRYLISNGNFSWQEVADFSHEFFADKTSPDAGQPGFRQNPNFRIDNSKSVRELGLSYTSKEATYRDAINQIVRFEEAKHAL